MLTKRNEPDAAVASIVPRYRRWRAGSAIVPLPTGTAMTPRAVDGDILSANGR